uniref:Uncharacterized protein n=1 Tax=Rhizophora mucronata TaxID=61149 RepID=A0A2P2QSE4_RHIMU
MVFSLSLFIPTTPICTNLKFLSFISMVPCKLMPSHVKMLPRIRKS